MENITRDQFPEIKNHLFQKEITVLIGPRQVGKTTLLYQLKQELLLQGTKEEEVLMFNLDVETDRKYFRSQTLFLEHLKSRIPKQSSFPALYVMVDEAQRVKDAGRFFKGVFDLNLNIKLVITGSSAIDIKAHVHESLTGRKRVFEILPFSFREYLEVKDKSSARLLGEQASEELQQLNLLPWYERYLVTGGYPKAVLAEDDAGRTQVLSELYESYLQKDVVGLLNIDNPVGFTNLIKSLTFQLGSLVNTQELSQSLGISRATVNKYLYLLEQTFIIFPVAPYCNNPRKEMKKMKKYYFRDMGLRNYIAENFMQWEFRMDKGGLLENAVAIELKRSILSPAELKFWRTKSKSEVDFVVEKEGKAIPIEVKQKYQSTRALYEFQKTYNTQKGGVVNMEKQGIRSEVGIKGVFPWNMGDLQN